MADASSSLSDSIRALGFEAGRFKTGTPCRLNANSIDFASLEVQDGDEPPPRLSFLERVVGEKDESFTLNFDEAGMFHVEQLPCWLTNTTPETHNIISANLIGHHYISLRFRELAPAIAPPLKTKLSVFHTNRPIPFSSNPKDVIPVKSTSTASLPVCHLMFS
jgi:tRNA uridine 5-carboxymethylaminomethyl modification enzyme